MTDKEFPKGLMVKAPHEKAPEFVKCTISIKRADLGNWLRSKSDDWINLDVKVSRDGKWYAEVNSWKKEDAKPAPKPQGGGDFDDPIPFAQFERGSVV